MASSDALAAAHPSPVANDGSLDFNEAMGDFKVMFPDVEAEVIEAVLRANRGGVDATIDHLLTMSADATVKGKGETAEEGLESPSPRSGLAYSHPDKKDDEGSVIPTQRMIQNRYEENLRNRERVRSKGGSVEPSVTQYLEDERVALMLQNEEFMAELRRDQEFISALERDSTPSPKPSSKNLTEEALFREKLKNMGKTSKKKFSQLASMFSRRKSGAKSLLGHAPAPSNDNLLLNAESLIEETDDDDRDSEEEEKESRSSMFSTKIKGGGKYSHFS